jgi:sulfite oxidase
VFVQGYAVSEHGVPIERIELSYDEGKSWIGATLLEQQAWSWCFWEIQLELLNGPCELIVRAWDVLQRTQPEAIAPIWNFKGYMNNAWHRVRIMVQDE